MFSKTLKMDRVDIFKLTRTIRLWRSRNLCVHQTTLSTWKINYRKWISLIFVHERANTKRKFYKLTTLTVFAAPLKDIPMSCKESVLPEPLLKNQNVNCLTYEQNTKKPYKDNLCLLRTIALHFHGNERLEEETSEFFKLLLNNCGEADPSKFQGVHMTDNPKVEEMLKLKIFHYDIDLVDGELTGELARRSIQKFEKSVRLIRYNNHICYVSDMNSVFKCFCCSTCDTIFSKTGNLEQHLITCSASQAHLCKECIPVKRNPLWKNGFFQYSIQRGSKVV